MVLDYTARTKYLIALVIILSLVLFGLPFYAKLIKPLEHEHQVQWRILAITKDEDYLQNPDIQAEVRDLERQIDQMVYKLYDLTPEEIAIVEGKR